MKTIITTTLIILAFVFSSQTQNETKNNNISYFNKGNTVAGIEFGIAGNYPIRSITSLYINKTEKNYGLLALPSYGWFVEKNWVIGGQAIAGFLNHNYYDSYISNNGQVTNTYIERSTDFGVAPFTRYYVPLGKRNVFSLFGVASLPVLYSSSRQQSKQTGSTTNNYSYSTYQVQVIASIGLGVSVNGRFGSLELNANSTGLYLGFHKYLRKI